MDDKVTKTLSDQKIEITGVEVDQEFENPSNIKRIRFNTSVGDITWKPINYNKVCHGGIIFKKIVPLCIDNIPEKIKTLAARIYKDGPIFMTTVFVNMDTFKDGIPVTYRFIRTYEQFNKWFEDD